MSQASQASRDRRLMIVTGGAGFIGSHLVDALVEQNFRVRVIDNFATGRRQQVNPAAELIEADIRDRAAIANLFHGVDGVFHTAALPRVPLSIEKPIETHISNVVGTLNVLVSARDAGVRRVINSGSSSVYGDQSKLPLTEDMAPNPMSPYALQKLTGEQYARLFCRLYKLQTLTLRYFNVYGPRMTSEGAYVTVIGVFLRARREGKPLTIEGDGYQTRDFTHVSDVVRANLLALDASIADGRAINIGYGRNTSVNQIAAMVGGATASQPARAGDVRDTLADVTQASQLLGWRPRVPIEEGIGELLRLNRL